MKKCHYVWAVAAALLLPGCSNDDLTDSASPGASYAPGDSEVEIQFAARAASVTTSVDKRATVDGDGDLDSMGVFCLAWGKQNINEAAPDIAWFNEDDGYASVLMANVKARKTGSNVTWDGHYFYPISQFYMYEFYAYYPYVEDADITYESTQDAGDGMPRHRATVNYTIDGTQDIIWGRATREEQYAYSARYFRGADAELPVVGLDHMLARLKFQVKPGIDSITGQAFADAGKVAVKKIEIINAHTKLDLIVADLERRSLPGSDVSEDSILTADERLVVSPEDEADGVLELKTAEDEDLPEEGVAIGTDPNVATPVGGCLMLYPSEQYWLRVTLHKESEEGEDGITVTLPTEPYLLVGPPSSDGSGENKFCRAMSYTVTITVNDFSEVEANASLNSWTESDSETSVEL